MLRRICRDCGQRHGAVRYRVHQHAVLCEPCFELRNEAADARRQRQYYGGSAPQTFDELLQQTKRYFNTNRIVLKPEE